MNSILSQGAFIEAELVQIGFYSIFTLIYHFYKFKS